MVVVLLNINDTWIKFLSCALQLSYRELFSELHCRQLLDSYVNVDAIPTCSNCLAHWWILCVGNQICFLWSMLVLNYWHPSFFDERAHNVPWLSFLFTYWAVTLFLLDSGDTQIIYCFEKKLKRKLFITLFVGQKMDEARFGIQPVDDDDGRLNYQLCLWHIWELESGRKRNYSKGPLHIYLPSFLGFV